MYSGCSGRAITCVTAVDQIVADVAADAAVGEADDVPFALDSDDEVGVDVDRAEVVHQDRYAKAVIAGEDAVQQRRLARAEEPRQHGERDGFACGSRRLWPSRAPPQDMTPVTGQACWKARMRSPNSDATN